MAAAETLRCSPLELAKLPEHELLSWLTAAGVWAQFRSWREERAQREAERG